MSQLNEQLKALRLSLAADALMQQEEQPAQPFLIAPLQIVDKQQKRVAHLQQRLGQGAEKVMPLPAFA